MKKRHVFSVAVPVSLVLALCLPAPHASARTFAEGSLIIPMDIDYQDHGTFKAFGLLYQLLLHDVPVYWVIDSEKSFTVTEDGDFFYDPDFTVSSVDVASEAVITDHGYRAGPFVIDAADAAAAMPIITQWQSDYTTTVDGETFPTVTVHRATESFEGEVSRMLTVAPTIAVFADGNQKVAFNYLNEAAIPSCAYDADGVLVCECWPVDKADCTGWEEGGGEETYTTVLDIAAIGGESTEIHNEGSLFDDEGRPLWCELMTMHWDEGKRDEAAIAEVHEFLQFPTHFMAECQAVNTVENAESGHFLTHHGFGDRHDEPHWTSVQIVNAYLPFVQFDGPYGQEGGSEPSFSPLYQNADDDWVLGAEGYIDQGVIMLTASGSPAGVHDVWMTGYVDGVCVIDVKPGTEDCDLGVGKVSYLGGHSYYNEHDGGVTPLTEHGNTQGMRLFLNSLFEADCVTTLGQPQMEVALEGPAVTNTPDFALHFSVENTGPGVGYDATLTQVLPSGLGFVSASVAPTMVDGSTLAWDLGNFAADERVDIDVQVFAAAIGTYTNQGQLDFRLSLNPRRVDSSSLETLYDPDADIGPDDGDPDAGDSDAGDSDAGGLDAGSDGGDDITDTADAEVPEGDATGSGDGGESDDADGSQQGADGSTGDGELTGDGSIQAGDGQANGGASSPTGEGCGCRTTPRSTPHPWPFVLAIIALEGRRRRARIDPSRE